MLAHLPSLAALESDDDCALVSELRLVRLRSQAAVVRTLADQVERASRVEDAEGLGEQLAEEVARLGLRLVEAAGSSTNVPRFVESGVFVRSPPSGTEADLRPTGSLSP